MARPLIGSVLDRSAKEINFAFAENRYACLGPGDGCTVSPYSVARCVRISHWHALGVLVRQLRVEGCNRPAFKPPQLLPGFLS
jgi:hypothetical protein